MAFEKLQAKTINTITVPQALKAELKTIRENGYAVDKEELIQGINCLAAPIRNNENKVVAAISISAPKVRVNKMVFEANKQLLLEAAQLISRKMGAKV